MLTKAQIQQLKGKLEHTKTDLEKELQGLQVTPEFGSDVDHGEEEADEAEALGTNLGIADALKKRLMNVTRALEKIAAGAYAECETCKKEMSFELLLVNPESRLCMQCKGNREQTKKS